MTPLGSEPGVIEVQPADLGADVESRLRGVQFGTNASYDAYKILAVFYPGLLAALVTAVRPSVPR